MNDSDNITVFKNAFSVWIIVAFILLAIGTINIFASEELPELYFEKINFVAQLLIGSGVIFAGLTYYNSLERQKIEDSKHQSSILLDSAKSGFKEVIDLLSDHNNDRVIWIRAARILAQTISLKENITHPEYIKAYDIEKFRCKGELYKILSLYHLNGTYEPLPPQFFYGIIDWQVQITLNDAAIRADANVHPEFVTLDHVLPEPNSSDLAIPSVIIIYDFLDEEEDFKDPLKLVRAGYEWGDDWESSYGKNQGAKRYVYHRSNYYAIGGVLYDRNGDAVEN